MAGSSTIRRGLATADRRAADGETLYSYDDRHRLVQGLRQDGSSIHLEYDAQGNLTCKTDR